MLQLKKNENLFLILVLCFLSRSLLASDTIDREAIRTALGVELVEYQRFLASDTFYVSSKSKENRLFNKRLRFIPHSEFVRRGDNIKKSMESTEMILIELRKLLRNIKDLDKKLRKSFISKRYHGAQLREILAEMGFFSVYELKKAIRSKEAEMAFDVSRIDELDKLKEGTAGLIEAYLTVPQIMAYLSSRRSALAGPEFRAICEEELSAILGE